MKNLKEILDAAKSNGVAVGHFNISDSTQFNGIVEAAQRVQVPVIIGVSSGEKKFIGLHNAAALVQSAKDLGKEVYLNLDHAHSVEECKEAIDAGFDSVIFDGADLPMIENITKTKEVVDYAKNTSTLVEAELGYIGVSSKVLDEVPEGAGLQKTTPEEAKDFVLKTGVDLLAPSVGNLHGMLKSGNPELDIDRISAIADAAGVPLVLHGGSGVSDSDFKLAINAGVSLVHINTEIRRAYRQGIEQAFKDDESQIAPYKYLNSGRDAVAEVVEKRLRLFSTKL